MIFLIAENEKSLMSPRISVDMPPEDWLCRKLVSLNHIGCYGDQARGTNLYALPCHRVIGTA